jgi:hypothetical protein
MDGWKNSFIRAFLLTVFAHSFKNMNNTIQTMTTFDLRRAHPEVRKIKQLLNNNSQFYKPTDLLEGMRQHKVLRVKVSKGQLNRALCFMDALIKTLEQRGAKFVKVESSELSEIRIDDERIECLLIEETKRTEKIDSKWQFDKWQWNPTGNFRFEIQEYSGSACRKKWNDSKQHRLEQQINSIVEGLFVCAKDSKQLAIKWAEEHRKREEAERRRQEAARQEALELARRKNLEEQAQRWVQSINLSTYIDACEKQMTDTSGQLQADSPETKWLAWAREHARRINPLANGFSISKIV